MHWFSFPSSAEERKLSSSRDMSPLLKAKFLKDIKHLKTRRSWHFSEGAITSGCRVSPIHAYLPTPPRRVQVPSHHSVLGAELLCPNPLSHFSGASQPRSQARHTVTRCPSSEEPQLSRSGGHLRSSPEQVPRARSIVRKQLFRVLT